jgi:hypothetical protein
VDANEILAVYASRGRGIPSAIEFLRKVLDSCECKPVIVVDRGPWYRWALERLGMTYFHETFGNRNRIERWFREMKERTKRFYNNVNSKNLKCLEELVTAIAAMHNIIRVGGEEVIPNLTVPLRGECYVFITRIGIGPEGSDMEVVKIRLPNADYVADLLRAVTAVIEEGTFRATQDGMRLVAMDPAHISLVDFKLRADAAEEFKVVKDTEITINVEELTWRSWR